MSEEPDVSTPQAASLSGTKKSFVKLSIIGVSIVAVVGVAFIVGKSFKKGESEQSAKPAQSLSLQMSQTENNDTSGLAELLLDTLELADIPNPLDSIELPLAQLTGSQVDTSEYVEIPGVEYLDDFSLLNASLRGDEIELDTMLEIQLGIAQPIRPSVEFPAISFGQGDTIPRSPVSVDTAAILAAFKPASHDLAHHKSDSLARVVYEKEQELQLLANDNQKLSSKLTRYSPKIDSTRAANIKRLVKIIETMSPVAAAGMLSSYTSDEITEILFKVKPRKASLILQQLPPNMASEIAVRVVRE